MQLYSIVTPTRCFLGTKHTTLLNHAIVLYCRRSVGEYGSNTPRPSQGVFESFSSLTGLLKLNHWSHTLCSDQITLGLCNSNPTTKTVNEVSDSLGSYQSVPP
jgi:hypothetical protein